MCGVAYDPIIDLNQAELCYKKANNDWGLTTVHAFLKEQAARSCKANDNHEGFIKESEEAVDLFLEVQLISNASKCLETLGRYEKAAC